MLSVSKSAFTLTHRLNVFPAVRAALPSNISILAYHRIAEPDAIDFYGLKDNVSATPRGFKEQLDYIKGEYNAISFDDLTAVMCGQKKLPENAVLITFDDGYLDNLTTALPELVRRDLPAVLFAVPGFLDGHTYPFWDWVTWAFHNSPKRAADLPLLGQRAWQAGDDAEQVADDWIEASRLTPHTEFRRALAGLSRVLELPLPSDAPPGLLMNWDDLQLMMQAGVTIGAHSVTHPILEQSSSNRAMREIKLSREILEERTKAKVSAFAYPSGLFTTAHEDMLAAAGYTCGFRVEGGLAFADELAERPYAIRRTCISIKDHMPRFAAKVGGAARLIAW